MNPIHFGAQFAQLDVFQRMLGKAYDLNEQDPNKQTPLEIAIKNERWDHATALVQAGASRNPADAMVMSMLDTSCVEFTEGNIDATAALDAKVVACLSHGLCSDPLSVFWAAVKTGRTDVVWFLVHNGFASVNQKDGGQISALYYAIVYEHKELALYFILHPQFRVNELIVPHFSPQDQLSLRISPIYSGIFSLHAAVIWGSLNLLQALMQIPGIDLNCLNGCVQTPLHIAMKDKKWAHAKILANAGASSAFIHPESKKALTDQLESFLHKSFTLRCQKNYADAAVWDNEVLSWLPIIGLFDHLEVFSSALFYKSAVIVNFFVDGGIDVNAPLPNRCRPLFYACCSQPALDDSEVEEVAKILWSHPQIKLDEPLTPAVIDDQLLEEGLLPEDALSFPVHAAARWELADMTEALINKKVYLNPKNGQGKTALDWAIKKRSWEIAEMLFCAGATGDVSGIEDCFEACEDEQEEEDLTSFIQEIHHAAKVAFLLGIGPIPPRIQESDGS